MKSKKIPQKIIKTRLEQAISATFPEKAAQRFLNRELSWLAFNERVLEEAENQRHPLLERVKFLSISASNLDEFIMVRVAGLKDQVKHSISTSSNDGLSPEEQLTLIMKRAKLLMLSQRKCWVNLQNALADAGVEVVESKVLSEKEIAWLRQYFMDNIFPALTPIAVDKAHPFPFLQNLGLAMVLQLSKKSTVTVLEKKKRSSRSVARNFQAIIPLPAKLERFVALPKDINGVERFVTLEDVLKLFHAELFPGFEVIGSGIIRVTRDSDLEVHDEAEDLVRYYESALKRRRRGEVVLLEASNDIPLHLLEFVAAQMNVVPEDTIEIEGMVGLSRLAELMDIPRPELKFPPAHIRFPERISDFGGDCLAAIHAKDIIVHHPYESFDVVVQFLVQAARDSDVVAIKQTLYRTSNDSSIVKALVEAAEAGKSVTALVELKARFDEEANIRWARDLERAGAQVVYGVIGLKTHTKVSLVVRRVDKTLRSYVHFGTGNYHPVTAKFYTDLSFFTSDSALCRDASHLFNYLTGYAPPEKFEKIAIAPLNLRKKLLHLIRHEIEHAMAGKPAHIWLKMNSLTDPELIDALYEASQTGVSIDLIIRGVCALRPGIRGFSDNIRVKSIVGRFLEHARIFCFGAGNGLPSKDAKVFISSADWMHRNLNSRIEALVPIENATVHEQVMGQIMVANLKDERQSWIMDSDGKYTRPETAPDSFSAHEFFLNNPSLSGRGKALKKV